MVYQQIDEVYKMKKQIIISSDSTCDLSSELIARYNIRILPMGVTLGDNSYRDGVDITPDDLYTYVEKTGQLPKTSAINMAEDTEFFEALTKDGSAVIHFTISSSMSGTYQNACLAAEDFEDVYVVDAKNLSTGSGLLVIAAAEMAQQGMEAGEIAKRFPLWLTMWMPPLWWITWSTWQRAVAAPQLRPLAQTCCS